MPLSHGKSKEVFSHNVAEMIRAGHPRAQALAASYAQQRKSRAAGGQNTNGFPPNYFPQLSVSQVASALPPTAMTPTRANPNPTAMAPKGVTSQAMPLRPSTPQVPQNRVNSQPLPQHKPPVPQFNSNMAPNTGALQSDTPQFGGYNAGGRLNRATGGQNYSQYVSNVPVGGSTGAPTSPYVGSPALNGPSVAQIGNNGIPVGSAAQNYVNSGSSGMASGGKIPQFRAGRAIGGPPPSSEMAPWFTRREASDQLHTSGLFGGASAGRADTLNRQVPASSYVLPSDIVSAIGQGNSLAGGNILTGMFHSGPWATGQSSQRGTPALRLPPAPRVAPQSGLSMPRLEDSTGGAKIDHGRTTVPIAASSGEFLVSPDAVQRIGHGSHELGFKILDAFVKEIRKRHIKTLQKLPGPKKD